MNPTHRVKVLACPDVPCTTNGKRVEVAVKKVLSGRPVNNASILKNPEALEWFKQYAADTRAETKPSR